MKDCFEFIQPLIKTKHPKQIGINSAKITPILPHGTLNGRYKLSFEKRNLINANISNKAEPQLKKLLIARLSEKSKYIKPAGTQVAQDETLSDDWD